MPFEVNGTFPESYWPFISETITKAHGSNWNGLNIVSIGDQDASCDEDNYVSKGANYTIIQPAGADGALLLGRRSKNFIKRNFNNVDDFDQYKGTFDVVINLGSLEHIKNQYKAWTITHNICKPNGVMIHIMPDAYEVNMYLRWYGHCHNYFGVEFYEDLCNNMNYELLANDLLHWNRSVGLKKLNDNEFNLNIEEFLSKITIR